MSSSLTLMGGCLCIEGGLWAWGAIQLTFWYWPEKNVTRIAPLQPILFFYGHEFCHNWTIFIHVPITLGPACDGWSVLRLAKNWTRGINLHPSMHFTIINPHLGLFGPQKFWAHIQFWTYMHGTYMWVLVHFISFNIRRWNFSTPEGKVSKGAAQAQSHDIKYFLLL